MGEGKVPVFLGRIAAHLREQNWFALGAEFVIVVLGVFLGLQAANWNEERQDRKDEEAILARLQDETATLLGAVREEREYLEANADLMAQARSVIFSQAESRPLTEAECRAVAGSHVYRREADQLPILEEMLATGRFDRVQDEAIKSQLRSYIIFRDRQRGNHEERTNELFRLYSRHPEAIRITLVQREEDSNPDFGFMSDEETKWPPQCDVARMRSNQQFLNELFDNMGRRNHVLMGYDEREAILTELQERLEEVPGS